MHTHRNRKTQRKRKTHRKRIRGGGKEDNKRNHTYKSMDMSSLFNDLPSVGRTVKPTLKQLALDKEKAEKRFAKTLRDTKKHAKEATKKEVDELADLFGKTAL
jgi:hypothetical protein